MYNMSDEPVWVTDLREKVESVDYEKEIYVISAPRCGNTITRYILEHLTGYMSYGYIGSGGPTGIDSRGIATDIEPRDESGIIFKRHSGGPGRYTTDKMSPDTRMITIIRNPLDWSLRTATLPGNWIELYTDVVSRALSNDFKKAKIIFYESLMTEPETYVKQLAEFIDSPTERIDIFIKNIDVHMNGKKAPEQRTPNKLEPNLQGLSEEVRIHKWNAFISKFPKHVQDFFNHHYPDGKWNGQATE
jgi:hypothetical protein